MAPSAPPRYQATIETREAALERAGPTATGDVELVARAEPRRGRRRASMSEPHPDVAVGAQRPTMENP